MFGPRGRLFGAGDPMWGSFHRVFAPTGTEVQILVTVVDGRVAPSQYDRHRAVESWYPGGLGDILAAISRIGAPSREPRLVTIDLRPPEIPCILWFEADPHEARWFVRVSESFQVELCALGD